MSYYNDHAKYGDFFDSHNPDRQNRQSNDRKPPKKKRRLKPFVKFLMTIIALTVILVIIAVSVSKCSGDDNKQDSASANDVQSSVSEVVSNVNTTPQQQSNRPTATNHTVTLGSQIESSYAVLVDTSNNTILARRNADEVIYPASMTKAVTLLIVAENIDDITATFKMTSDIIDPLYREGLTLAGFAPGEDVRIIDMIYGMVLESGAEASVGLATHIAGSEAEFVKLMNQKVQELGLKNTHFTNVSGLHNKNHYTTCTEMAMIMQEVIKNDFCREIISTEWYTVAKNNYHEELKFHSGMFQKMYGNEPEVAIIKGGKTGFTSQSLYCLVSFAVTEDGRDIICVTAKGEGKYSPIYDCIKLYKDYTHPDEN